MNSKLFQKCSLIFKETIMSNQDEKVLTDVQIVCAVAEDGTFGYKNPDEHDNQMPWGYIRQDMLNFKALTSLGVVMMGTNTYGSLPEKFRPLPGRHNVVIGKKNVPAQSEHVSVFSDIDSALDVCYRSLPNATVFLIGGKQLIEAFLSPENDYAKHVSAIHRTMIMRDVAVSPEGVIKEKNTFVFFDNMLHPDRYYTDFFLNTSKAFPESGIITTTYVARREI